MSVILPRRAVAKSAIILVLLALVSSTAVAQEEPVCNAGDATCSDESNDVTADQSHGQQQQQEQHQHDGPPAENMFRCQNIEDECDTWAKYQFSADRSKTVCEINSAFMTQYCPLTCNTCEEVYLGFRLSHMLEGGLKVIPFCQDDKLHCKQYADAGECDKNPEYMQMMCRASCGVCSVESNQFGVYQILHKNDPEKSKKIQDGLNKTIEYMRTVKRDRKYSRVRKDCLNKVPDCTLWAAQGECEHNPAYMKSQCAPACMSCDYLGDTSETCMGLPESAGPLWKPGDLNAFFEEVVGETEGKGEYYSKFNPKVLSRPKQKSDGTQAADVKKDGPWVILLENFLSDKEAEGLIHLGLEQGYQRSVRAISPGSYDTVDGRTSGNTWCKNVSCMEDPTAKPVLERIAAATKSTIKHSEHLQLLRYGPGQLYDRHHDYIPYQLDQPCGARIMTLFLYLNDVEEGGETEFPELGISVKPKRGNALLWPSVLDEDPVEKDPRTEHEAKEVIKGVKFAANAWIHSEDFQTPHALNCM